MADSTKLIGTAPRAERRHGGERAQAMETVVVRATVAEIAKARGDGSGAVPDHSVDTVPLGRGEWSGVPL